MMTKYAFLSVLAILCAAQQTASGQDGQWILDKSTLTYHVSHPLHQTEGFSHAAKGKGLCHEGQCKFLIAVPVKSFESGDTNRDLHMLQVVRGAQFPLVTVRLTVPENGAASTTVKTDLQVEFAGQTVHYVEPVQVTIEGNGAHVTGTIPATMSDFKIDPPTLLGIACKNEMPVRVDMTWHRQ
jgi:hypothetical protein